MLVLYGTCSSSFTHAIVPVREGRYSSVYVDVHYLLPPSTTGSLILCMVQWWAAGQVTRWGHLPNEHSNLELSYPPLLPVQSIQEWQSFNLLSSFRCCAIPMLEYVVVWCCSHSMSFIVYCVCALYMLAWVCACVHAYVMHRACLHTCLRAWVRCGHVCICITFRIVRTASCTNCSNSRWSSDVYYQLYKSRPRYIL